MTAAAASEGAKRRSGALAAVIFHPSCEKPAAKIARRAPPNLSPTPLLFLYFKSRAKRGVLTTPYYRLYICVAFFLGFNSWGRGLLGPGSWIFGDLGC